MRQPRAEAGRACRPGGAGSYLSGARARALRSFARLSVDGSSGQGYCDNSTKSIDKGDNLYRIQLRALLLTLVALPLVAAGCGGSSGSIGDGGGGSSVKLNLVAYSTPAEAYAQLIPDFQKTAAGKGVDFSQSYGSSGDQSRAVDAGQAADFVHFALEPDVQRLVD